MFVHLKLLVVVIYLAELTLAQSNRCLSDYDNCEQTDIAREQTEGDDNQGEIDTRTNLGQFSGEQFEIETKPDPGKDMEEIPVNRPAFTEERFLNSQEINKKKLANTMDTSQTSLQIDSTAILSHNDNLQMNNQKPAGEKPKRIPENNFKF